MNVEKDLKKDGIIAKIQLNRDFVLDITNNIAQKIVKKFPNFCLNETELSSRLFCLNMYKAHMPEGMAEATYCYKNSTIYFNENIPNEELEEFAIHECLHYLQEVKDEQGKILKMGLSTYSTFGKTGLGLNEAAVQYISSKIIGVEPDFEKYYDINIYTPSPSYYPIVCSLLNELLYFVNEDILFKSTFFSTNDFKNEIISKTSLKVYEIIQSSFDNILKNEEKILLLNNKIQSTNNEKKIIKMQQNIFDYRKNINTTFFTVQNLIIKEFFDYEFNQISNLQQLDNFRKKITNFGQLIGVSENYIFFDNYYYEIMKKLEQKEYLLENGNIKNYMISKKTSIISKLIRKIKALILREKENKKII